MSFLIAISKHCVLILSAVKLSVAMLSLVMPAVIMMTFCYAECDFDKCHFVECRSVVFLVLNSRGLYRKTFHGRNYFCNTESYRVC